MKTLGISDKIIDYAIVSKIETRLADWSAQRVTNEKFADRLIEPGVMQISDENGVREDIITALENTLALFPTISLWSIKKVSQSKKSSFIDFFLSCVDCFQNEPNRLFWRKSYNLSLSKKWQKFGLKNDLDSWDHLPCIIIYVGNQKLHLKIVQTPSGDLKCWKDKGEVEQFLHRLRFFIKNNTFCQDAVISENQNGKGMIYTNATFTFDDNSNNRELISGMIHEAESKIFSEYTGSLESTNISCASSLLADLKKRTINYLSQSDCSATHFYLGPFFASEDELRSKRVEILGTSLREIPVYVTTGNIKQQEILISSRAISGGFIFEIILKGRNLEITKIKEELENVIGIKLTWSE